MSARQEALLHVGVLILGRQAYAPSAVKKGGLLRGYGARGAPALYPKPQATAPDHIPTALPLSQQVAIFSD
jgi:hypothetical protein